MNSYEKLNELENENEILFKIALGEITHRGIDYCLIENAKIPMFSDEWARILVRMMRDISRIENEDSRAINKYIQVSKIYNTNGFKPRKKKN